MAKVKYGVFDSQDRKVVGILHVEPEKFMVEVNGETIDLAKRFLDFDGCDITITVSNKEEDLA